MWFVVALTHVRRYCGHAFGAAGHKPGDGDVTTPGTTKKLAALTGIALVGVIGVGSVVGSNSTADDLTPKAYKALVSEGLSNIKVDFDGREATLSNGSPEELARAEKIVEGVKGVRLANIDTDQSTSLPKPPTLSITTSADGVNVSGVVPNAEVAKQIRAAAEATFGTVTGDLRVDPNVGAADWLSAVPTLIPNAGAVQDLALSIDGDSVAIGGSMSSQESIDVLSALVGPAVGDMSIDNTLQTSTDQPTAETSASEAAGDESGAITADEQGTIKASTVYFNDDVARFVAADAKKLDALATILKQHPDVTVIAGGHSGPGVEAFVRKLAQSRIDAVRKYLIGKGVSPDQIQRKNYGADKGARVGVRQNRRVDFIVKGN